MQGKFWITVFFMAGAGYFQLTGDHMERDHSHPSGSKQKTQETGISRHGQNERATRVAQIVRRLKASLRAQPTEDEETAYCEMLLSLNLGLAERAAQLAVAETTIPFLPLPAQFAEFYERAKQERENLSSMAIERRLREEYEIENADGSIDMARNEFRAEFKRICGEKTFPREWHVEVLHGRYRGQVAEVVSLQLGLNPVAFARLEDGTVIRIEQLRDMRTSRGQ